MSFGEFYAATSGIGKAYTDGLEEYRQRGGLAKLGQMVQGGDYAGAASTAFDLGDTQTGVGLLKLGQAQRQQQLEQQAGADFAQGLNGMFGTGGVEAPKSLLGRSSTNARALPAFADDSAPSGNYVANLFKRESNNNPTAQASTSSAKGLGQFTDRTWAGVMRSHPELGLTPDGRTDPNQMLRATNAFTADNERILQRAGLPVNDSTRYASHFLGASGGPRFVAGALSNPDAPAVAYVQPEQARANRRIFFNRDGTPKTAGQVMADFGGSFGGGGSRQVASTAQRAPQVAYADDEAQTQALERRMGMVPATVTAEADLPMPSAQEAAFYIPGTEPAPARATGAGVVPGFPPSIAGERVNSPSPRPANSVSPPSVTGGTGSVQQFPTQAPTDRVMTVPDSEPVQGVAPVQMAEAGGAIGNIPAGTIAQSPLGQRIPFLLKAAAMPNLPDNQRQLAQTLLKQALDETKMPDGVKEYTLARSQGFTGSYLDYQRELKRPGGPTVLSAGQTVYDEKTNTGRYTAPAAERASGVTADIEARRGAALENALTPGSPAYQSYILTGKMPREDAQPLTAGDKKAIQEADTAVLSSQTVIDMLGQAKKLSKQAYEGPTASYRATATGLFGSEAGVATQDLDNLVTTQALGQLKAIFGGAPTEGERAILLDIQGSSSKPDVVRQRIYDRAIGLANLRLQQNQEKAAELRGQTYYKPGSGPRGRDAAGSTPQHRALPAPTQANRPNAVAAPDRFQQLMGSGLSKQQAYERLEQEGY